MITIQELHFIDILPCHGPNVANVREFQGERVEAGPGVWFTGRRSRSPDHPHSREASGVIHVVGKEGVELQLRKQAGVLIPSQGLNDLARLVIRRLTQACRFEPGPLAGAAL
jgi:hypothetical protein